MPNTRTGNLGIVTLKLPAFDDLEEANLPAELARFLSGCTATVGLLPDDSLAGCRDDYHSVRLLFTDPEGKVWRLPRRWLAETQPSTEPRVDGSYSVSQEFLFSEMLHLPTAQDLADINIPWTEAEKAAGRQNRIFVRLHPHEAVKVFWRDSTGGVWRIPRDWRRRRVKLPACAVLISQGIPFDIAEEFGETVVSVNYHLGSLCCLPEHYRFRDQNRNRWPVRIQDCTILGYGDAEEHRV